MRIVDARSGKTLTLGKRVDRGRGEWIELVSYRPGIFSANATLRRAYRDMNRARELSGSRIPGVFYPQRGRWSADPLTNTAIFDEPTVTLDPLSAPLIEDTVIVPLLIRFTHPKYFLQHVGFIGS